LQLLSAVGSQHGILFTDNILPVKGFCFLLDFSNNSHLYMIISAKIQDF